MSLTLFGASAVRVLSLSWIRYEEDDPHFDFHGAHYNAGVSQTRFFIIAHGHNYLNVLTFFLHELSSFAPNYTKLLSFAPKLYELCKFSPFFVSGTTLLPNVSVVNIFVLKNIVLSNVRKSIIQVTPWKPKISTTIGTQSKSKTCT